LTLVMIICGARITVEYGDEILAYDIEGDCRFLGVI
jgi:hypothetical protein